MFTLLLCALQESPPPFLKQVCVWDVSGKERNSKLYIIPVLNDLTQGLGGLLGF